MSELGTFGAFWIWRDAGFESARRPNRRGTANRGGFVKQDSDPDQVID
jgi:hypothetical protein